MRRRRTRRDAAPEATVYLTHKGGSRYLLRFYANPEDSKRTERSIHCTSRREAERERAALEEELSAGLYTDDRLSWYAFRTKYETERLPALAEKSGAAWRTAANALEEHCKPTWLVEVTPALMSRFAARLRKSQAVRETSIASYLRTIRAAINWGARLKLCHKLDVSVAALVPRAKGVSKLMRSRPIVGEERDRLQQATEKVRPHDAEAWRRLLRALPESALRVSELLGLSWDDGQPLSIDASDVYPVIRIASPGEKSHQDRLLPISRDFWRVLCETPEGERTGPAFPIRGRRGQMSAGHVIKIIGQIGRKAGVITDPTTGKCASSHDIGKRAFATHWGAHLSENELAELMRHESSATTKRYYYAPHAQALAARLWQEANPEQKSGTKSGKGQNLAPTEQPADDTNHAGE